ncbi:MAG: peptide deformylase [Alphaproteobacteria bacterium]|jgi:peptide deformylase|nr:peptide deformylase [Alphaproteobacteria bacterium]MBT4084521.1 peptide deformylase [Alphaproteobacteria bacterium]MBT4545391.1 peptide deformylase [Alphaproteobacteria bacterium]MBT7745585.1 peptide deformylase [Alphaproteobacteria bacterium]
MAVLPIIVAPDPRLKVVSEPVSVVDDGIRALLDDMLASMYDAVGIGLAAIQVGVNKRIVVIDVVNDKGEQGNPVFLINPEIVWTSDDDRVHEEGCLSLPEHYAEVVRPDEVRVTYLDRDGEAQELHAAGILSTCIQHELDHLEGILFVDHISSMRRNMILRKLKKLKRQNEPVR